MRTVIWLIGLVVGVVLVVFIWMVDQGYAGERCSGSTVLVSWYGKETCHGRPPGHGKGFCQTASGIPFDGSQVLVANKELPFGTRVRFTYRGRLIVLRVEDRGPYIRGRAFDLSHGAAILLGFTGVHSVCAAIVR